MRIAPRSGEATVAESFQAAVADKVPCPFMATMVKQGRFQIDADGRVDFDNLRAALKLVGLSLATREILVRGTQSVEKERLAAAGALVKGMEVESFDITKLHDTSLMHTGDLKIRRGGFKQERLDWLLSFSSDGKTLTVADLARAQAQAVKDDPGARGHAIGMAELSALLRLFGTRNADGDKCLTREALVSLFKDNELPAGWKPKGVGVANVFAGIAGIAFHQVFTTTGRSAASLDKALDRRGPVDQSGATGLGRAICPAGMRPTMAPVSKAEAQAMHASSAD